MTRHQPSHRRQGSTRRRLGRLPNSRAVALLLLLTACAPLATACSRDIELVPENKPLSANSLQAVERLKSEDPMQRYEAAKELGDLGPEVELAAPALIESMRTEQVTGVRWGIVWALGRIGPAAPGVIEALSTALADSDDHRIRNGSHAITLSSIESQRSGGLILAGNGLVAG